MNKQTRAKERRVDKKYYRRLEIAAKYKMTKNIRSYMFITATLLLITIVLVLWSFAGLHDSFLSNIAENQRMTIGWISLVSGLVFVVLTLLLFSAFRNAKKHVSTLIENYDKKYPQAKYDGEGIRKIGANV